MTRLFQSQLIPLLVFLAPGASAAAQSPSGG